MGGGRKAKSITSLLEHGQKGKDMSQWTDCFSLSLSLACSCWKAAKPLVFKSPVLELEFGSVGIGTLKLVCADCRIGKLEQVSPEGPELSTASGPEQSYRGLTGQ